MIGTVGPERDPFDPRDEIVHRWGMWGPTGVDVAFTLATRPSDAPDEDQLKSWWQRGSGPVVGMSVGPLAARK